MKVVVDTNVLISHFISPKGNATKIFHKWENAEFIYLASAPILIEYREVLFSDKVRRYHQLSVQEMNEAIAKIETQTEHVEVEGTLTGMTIDPDDDKFIECAVNGGAEFIISGDKHLLNLKTFEEIEIVDPATFLHISDLF